MMSTTSEVLNFSTPHVTAAARRTGPGTGARLGWWTALAALETAGKHHQGILMETLIKLVADVGQVSESTAYQTLRVHLRASRVAYTGPIGPGRGGMSLAGQVVQLMEYLGEDRP